MKLPTLSLDENTFLRQAVKVDSGSLQKAVTELKRRESRKPRKLATMPAARDHSLLCRAETEQACQIERASTAVLAFAVTDARVA